jgi:PAS domain S-box-containing protein
MDASTGPERAGGGDRRQQTVAEFGDRALATDDVDGLLRDATVAVSTLLGTEYCAVFAAGDGGLVLREGVGWRDGTEGVLARRDSQATRTLRSGEPVVVTAFDDEERFAAGDLLASHGVESGVTVVIGPDEDPWGVLGAYATEPRAFPDDDITFLRSMANVLASAIETDRTERELAAEKALKERIVETIPIGISVVGPEGDIQFMNSRAEELVGRSLAEVTPVDHDDPRWDYTDDDGDPLDEEEMPFERVVSAGEPVYDLEIGVRHADGQRVRLRVDGAPLSPDASAEFADDAGDSAVFAFTDVTEQRRLESEFEEMLARITDAFYALDEEFRFTHVNDRAEELLEASEEELLGEVVWDAFPEAAEMDEVCDSFHTAMDEQASTSLELFYDPLDLWVEGNVYPSETGISVYFRDVTDRKEREQALKRANEQLSASNKRLEGFAYAASHDLQEPLRMVSSYLRLIEDRYGDELDADGREFLDYAVDGADRMKEMIDGLLAYSRVETCGETFERVQLDKVFQEVCKNLQVCIEESDASVSADCLPAVTADRAQCEQVFQNLLSNAIEYSGDAPPRVHVDAEREGEMWRIDVADEGIGIDPDETDRVFEVFERLHSHDEHPGTGIGLALCRRIVERHGGDIEVDSEPGEGTTFSFTLPAADAGDEPPVTEPVADTLTDDNGNAGPDEANHRGRVGGESS